jgi:hypothetical protein
MYLSYVFNIRCCENVKSHKDYHVWTQIKGPSEFYGFITIITSLNHPQMVTLKRLKCGIHGMQTETVEGERTQFLSGTGKGKGKTERGMRKKGEEAMDKQQ